MSRNRRKGGFFIAERARVTLRPHKAHCPYCGRDHLEWVNVDGPPDLDRLSSVALAILTARSDTANQWRRGKATVSIRQWQRITGRSPSQIWAALRELADKGYVTTTPYGQRGRVQYVGIEATILSDKVRDLIAA